MAVIQEMVADLKRRPLWQRVGLIFCISGACASLGVGFAGIVMILYWHQVTHDWLGDHIFFWMSVGMPSTIAIFFFTRMSDLFR